MYGCMCGIYRIFLFDHWINVKETLPGIMKSGGHDFLCRFKKAKTNMFVNAGRVPLM